MTKKGAFKMPRTKKVEVWIVMDADGNYVAACDRDCAIENYSEGVGSVHVTVAKIMVEVPVPQVVVLPTAVAADHEQFDLGGESGVDG
jgi:hypothetical protein